jgi:hypothetical protein
MVKVCSSWGTDWGMDGFVKIKRGFSLCSIAVDSGYPTVKTAAPKPLKPINTPTDCDVIENIYNSSDIYLKSVCIDFYTRNYEGSRVNCLTRGMQLYKADSPEASTAVRDIANLHWTLLRWSVIFHIHENATGPLFVSNVNPLGWCEITTGNKTAHKLSICEYKDVNCELNFSLKKFPNSQFILNSFNSSKPDR